MRKITREEYPKQLLEIPEPPESLFIQGALPAPGSRLLSVVGSRKYTPYGKESCAKIISDLRGHNITIVSGLALGIDAIAHQAALDAGLLTIAFPGSGLDPSVLYPASNFALARRIVERGGALISEFEPTFRATPYAFPQRNRLMAGISDATLVIEATEKSGTLITARLALDYNRDVFAVPGPIFSANSAGSNRLLKQGAIPATCGNDILEYWGMDTEKEEKGKKSRVLESCSAEEKQVLHLLTEPLAKDDLICALKIPVREANILLSTMEIKGLIKEIMGEMQINF